MEYDDRLGRLRRCLAEESCDAFFVENALDLFYFTGCQMSAGKLLVTANDAFLIVDGRYFEACKARCHFPVLKAEDKPLPDLLQGIKVVAFDATVMTYQQVTDLQKMAAHIKLHPLGGVLQKLRSIKEPAELEALRVSAKYAVAGFHFLQTLIKEQVSEKELAQALEIFWKQQGSQALSFDPIIAVGANSAMPHYRAGQGKVEPGKHVLCDIGVQFNHYHSDMTRIVYCGQPDPKILEIEEIVVEAYLKAEAICRAGVTAGELDRAARGHITSKGYGEQFTHSLGHGVGLEIHEYPLLRDRPSLGEVVLQAGMVITLEPGIYLPGIGGVRFENTVIVQKHGCEVITS